LYGVSFLLGLFVDWGWQRGWVGIYIWFVVSEKEGGREGRREGEREEGKEGGRKG